MKRLLFITGTRADFGKTKPLILAAKQAGCEVQIFATGMHMLKQYDLTHYEIKKAGLDYFPYYNMACGMDGVLASTIAGLSNYVHENRPDLLIVHGDRVEAMAGACVGALNNILTAHIEGGEVSGTVDELLRHSISKLAHVHFVSNEDARRRVEQMGEDPASIFVIGSPDIDVMLGDLPDLEEVKRHYEIDFNEYAICIYHPVTTEPVHLDIFNALEDSHRDYVIILPNNDTGAEKITEKIYSLQGDLHFKIIRSMRFEYFLTLLKNAAFIIGNSSTGVHEAPVYGVPTINIGSRQAGRYSGPSVMDVLDSYYQITMAIQKPPDRQKPDMYFGKGNSAELFCKALPRVWDISPQKAFHDAA
jgi:UDP-N-acetylglucosamine 2-epimerase (hydrolysing)